MTEPHLHSETETAFQNWLEKQIQNLSVDALSAGVATCVACSKSTLGEYVIDYRGRQMRYMPGKTYAFLKFVVDSNGAAAK